MSSTDTASPTNGVEALISAFLAAGGVTVSTFPTVAAALAAGTTQKPLYLMSRRTGKSTMMRHLFNWKNKPPMSDNSHLIRTLAGNLAKALQEAGIKSFHLSYTGSGDSTDGFTIEEIAPMPGREVAELEQAMATKTLVLTSSKMQYQEGEWQTVSYSREETLEDAAFVLAEMLWNHAGQGGWYNNDGGGGSLFLDISGTYNFRHYNNVTAEEVACAWESNIFVDPIDNPAKE